MFYRPLLLLLALLALNTGARADAWLIEVDGAIGPAVADHFVRGLEQAEAANAELGVTASFGVATATDGLASRPELIATADAAIHAAKTQGRNRVEGGRTRAYDPSAADAG